MRERKCRGERGRVDVGERAVRGAGLAERVFFNDFLIL